MRKERWRGAVIDPPQPPSPCREIGNEGVKPGKGCGEKAWFNACFCFSKKKKIKDYSIGNKTNFPQVESVLPVTVTSEQPPSLYLYLQAFSSYFLPLPVPMRKGSERVAGCASGCWPRSIHCIHVCHRATCSEEFPWKLRKWGEWKIKLYSFRKSFEGEAQKHYMVWRVPWGIHLLR